MRHQTNKAKAKVQAVMEGMRRTHNWDMKVLNKMLGDDFTEEIERTRERMKEGNLKRVVSGMPKRRVLTAKPKSIKPLQPKRQQSPMKKQHIAGPPARLFRKRKLLKKSKLRQMSKYKSGYKYGDKVPDIYAKPPLKKTRSRGGRKAAPRRETTRPVLKRPKSGPIARPRTVKGRPRTRGRPRSQHLVNGAREEDHIHEELYEYRQKYVLFLYDLRLGKMIHYLQCWEMNVKKKLKGKLH